MQGPLWVRQQMTSLEALVIRDVFGSIEEGEDQGFLHLGDLKEAGRLPGYLSVQQANLVRRLKEQGYAVAPPTNISVEEFQRAMENPKDSAATRGNKPHLICTLFRLQGMYPEA